MQQTVWNGKHAYCNISRVCGSGKSWHLAIYIAVFFMSRAAAFQLCCCCLPDGSQASNTSALCWLSGVEYRFSNWCMYKTKLVLLHMPCHWCVLSAMKFHAEINKYVILCIEPPTSELGALTNCMQFYAMIYSCHWLCRWSDCDATKMIGIPKAGIITPLMINWSARLHRKATESCVIVLPKHIVLYYRITFTTKRIQHIAGCAWCIQPMTDAVSNCLMHYINRSCTYK